MVKCLGYKLNYFYMCSLGNIKKNFIYMCIYYCFGKRVNFYKVFGYKIEKLIEI